MDFMKKVNQLTEKVGGFAVDAYKTVAHKADSTIQETKVKLIINERLDEIEGIYSEIGRNVYRLYKRGENVEDFEANCKMVQKLEDEKLELQDTLLKIRDQKRCENCNTVMPKDMVYCPSCGYDSMPNKEEKEDKKETAKKETVKKEVKKTEEKAEVKMVKIPLKKPVKKEVNEKELKEIQEVIDAEAKTEPKAKVSVKKTVKKEVKTEPKAKAAKKTTATTKSATKTTTTKKTASKKETK